jgi:hypothetical protein
MTSETIKAELQNNFRRTGRPVALAFGHLDSFQKTANVKQQTREFRADRIKRMTHTLTGRNYRVG